MSTGAHDMQLVADLSDADRRVVPAFGIHPWAAHTVSLAHEQTYADLFGDAQDDATSTIAHLPARVPLADALAQQRALLQQYPDALVGEVGLDRSFRLPAPQGSPTRFSSLQTPIEHQLAVLRAQINVAKELARSVSMHSVRAAGHTLELLDEVYAADGPHPSTSALRADKDIVLHSCTLSPESIRQVQRKHRQVYVSFSTTINARQRALDAQIAAADPARILSESDTSSDFAAHTRAATARIAHVWHVDEATAAARLAANFSKFHSNDCI
ncbi:Cut9-interacting protein scn1 [Malassezia cuniculi]|uniref:Cut9-interacting protein scn1 n=1 Tax=Malassezia cuniculi TaxID=948313 RepID=A0AAF0ESG9_9BASI|nr:Cut9-interacting protein scn1 [Malassezia cuniculi]